MSSDPYRPNADPPQGNSGPGGTTDPQPLLSAPALQQVPKTREGSEARRTDFRSLAGKDSGKIKRFQRRTATDWLIDALTPALIFLMVFAVIYFLLDVRYVFTEVHSGNLRFVVFPFLVGVVALNRLVAREGSAESVLYIAALAGAVGLYTFCTTDLYDVGSMAGGFLNQPGWSTLFNMGVVAFIWWLVNRLTHECCVDENRTAGDVGILTGTARKMKHAFKRDPQAVRRRGPLFRKRNTTDIMPMYELEAFDPVQGYKPKEGPKPKPRGAVSDRLPKRRPGISIFYFSVPVMFIFAVGLRVVQHGGERMVKAGLFYMGLYTVTALMLLMLTSLGGLRQYFRSRKVTMPAGIGWFWIGLGTVMIAIVLVGAMQLPMPDLPPIAYVAEHQTDFWTRGSKFTLSEVSATPVGLLDQSRFIERVGVAVLWALGAFAAYAALKGLGAFAARIARRRDRYPMFVVRFFDALDRLLLRLTRLPRLPARKRRVRVQRELATCAGYANSMGDPERSERMNTNEHVTYAYQALCALAYDLGVPRNVDQTPYEFIRAFPKELEGLEEEAAELTRLYVLAAYSPIEMDERVQDRLRKFWIRYERTRGHILR